MIGEKIKRLREVAGLTQRDLAKSIGMSLPTLAKIEGGHHSRKIRKIWIDKIESFFNLESGELHNLLVAPKTDLSIEGVIPTPEEIKRIRVEKGMTQFELSKLSGINITSICNLERGRRFSDDTLIILGNALGLDLGPVPKKNKRGVIPVLKGENIRVASYDLEGNLLEVIEGTSYADIAVAFDVTPIGLTDCLRGKIRQTRGFQFRLIRDELPVWKTIGDITNATRTQEPFLKIYKGRVIAMYESLEEAERKSKVNISGISRCLSGEINEAGGFNWVKANRLFDKPIDGSVVVSKEDLEFLRGRGIDLEILLKKDDERK